MPVKTSVAEIVYSTRYNSLMRFPEGITKHILHADCTSTDPKHSRCSIFRKRFTAVLHGTHYLLVAYVSRSTTAVQEVAQ